MVVDVKVLGIAQDGGHPHAACRKVCCTSVQSPADINYPVALGITESDGTTHLIEATPNVADQLRFVWRIHNAPTNIVEDFSRRGVDHLWVTHAHMGHCDGLRQFGREVMHAKGIKLHVSLSMAELIAKTPIWNIMVEDWRNFILEPFNTSMKTGDELISEQAKQAVMGPSGELLVEPVRVPHRGELSDMHAFIFRGIERSLLFLPDHDTWKETLELYESETIREFLKKLKVDIALIDGTFWSLEELGQSRDQREVPHPPICKSLEMLGQRQPHDPDIYFTHLNHTNPILNNSSKEYKKLTDAGWKVATQGMVFLL